MTKPENMLLNIHKNTKWTLRMEYNLPSTKAEMD